LQGVRTLGDATANNDSEPVIEGPSSRALPIRSEEGGGWRVAGGLTQREKRATFQSRRDLALFVSPYHG
jgi:hypothetical protein